MTDQSITDSGVVRESPFERIKRIDPDGNEYWTGRELMYVLGYATWQRITPAFQEIYSSLCLENSSQLDMMPSSKMVLIGSGALREVEDWRLSRSALDRILSRVASHKPEAVRELRRHSEARFRIETEIGAILLDFCEAAGLGIIQQLPIENYRFDFCIAEKLLIEVDEARHQTKAEQSKDKLKDRIAVHYGYKLLRVTVPLENIAKLCGIIFRLLNEEDYHG